MCHFGTYLYPILTLQFNILTAVRSMRQVFYVCFQSILNVSAAYFLFLVFWKEIHFVYGFYCF